MDNLGHTVGLPEIERFVVLIGIFWTTGICNGRLDEARSETQVIACGGSPDPVTTGVN